MTPVDVLLQLQKLDVRVWLEGGELRYSAAPQDLPADLRQALAAQEAEVVGFLREAGADEPALVQVPRDQPLPLSSGQLRFWFLSQMAASSAAYVVPLVVALRGELDAQALCWSLEEIIWRHEALRTTFRVLEGQPVQVIHEPWPLELPVVDVSELPDPKREAQRLVLRAAAEPFDLVRGPVFRVELLRLGPTYHVLMVLVHHVAMDEWSHSVLSGELIQLYAARVAGQPSPLPELAVQYADWAVWQRQRYERQAADLLAYWRQQLSGARTLELPTDRPRPAVQTFAGRTHAFSLERRVGEALLKLGRAEGCSGFMSLLALFVTLLSRVAGQDDVVVGTPVANRGRPETEALIGLFLNTLVLRTDLSGEPSFRELLRRVRRVALDAFDHSDMPFEELVRELEAARDLSRNPLFQVLFQVNEPSKLATGGGLDFAPFPLENSNAKFDLTLTLIPSVHGITGSFEYNLDLFEPETVARLEQHLQGLLRAVVAEPDRPVWQLDFTTAEERRLFAERNATARDYPRDRTFVQLLEARVAERRGAVAAEADGVRLTYGELNAAANRLAHQLRALGARPGVLVGIALERSLDSAVAILAVMKSGAAYVPIDPSHPAERVAFVIEDAGLALLVTLARHLERLPPNLPRVVCLDAEGDAAARAAQPAVDPPAAAGPDDLAYVMFTSGSTGKPKGVEIQHRALVNFLNAMAERPGIRASDVLLAVTTISFDIAGLELLLPLQAGARVMFAPAGVEIDGRSLAALLADCGATIMQATPATWQLLLEAGWQGQPDLVVLCGGEALPRELANRLLPRCRELWNLYGPTEATIWSLVQRVSWGEDPVPIGEPIANTEALVLDARRQPVPIGAPGVLFLGGDGLARGYWRRPELTAAKFVPHPTRPGARLYDTGDLVRYRRDGRLEFLGRVDHQVKVRGFRIELGEIEHALAAHDAVADCAVVAQTRGSGDRLLVAHVVFRVGGSATASELRAALRAKLPDYMVPSRFVVLHALPRTPSGKVDRRLLEQHESGQVGAREYAPPQTPTENYLARLWRELLELERAGRDDNFFELGGHSLLAMKAVYRIERELGVRAYPAELLVQNLAQLGAMCDRRAPAAATPRDRGASPREGEPGEAGGGGGGLWSRLRRRLGSGRSADRGRSPGQ